MSADLILAPETADDIRHAYLWYEDRRCGLGEEFLGSLEACLEAVRRMPERCEKVHDDYRRALLRRFPYAVFYESHANIVTVFCIFHTSQNPAKWLERLP